jgi:hypothetical protein
MAHVIKLKENWSSPSFRLAGERVGGRSNAGVSQPAVHWRQCIGVTAARRGLTRSTLRWTALSFASKKEGKKAELNDIGQWLLENGVVKNGGLFMGSRRGESNDKKSAGKCDSPLERGGGVCSLRHAFTLLHGGKHTPPQHIPTHPLSRGEIEKFTETYTPPPALSLLFPAPVMTCFYRKGTCRLR